MQNTTTETRNSAIITTYKRRLERRAVRVVKTVEVWHGFFSDEPDADLADYTCWTIDPENIPTGFASAGYVPNTDVIKYQYNLRAYNDLRVQRPVAWRVPFLNHENYDTNCTISHLCHNPSCYNWDHHALEPLEVNKARNGCPGGSHCHHVIKCLIPGPYHDK